ncbi:hypothetical protein OQA88_606 [Cercophora sp. LCS_1]
MSLISSVTSLIMGKKTGYIVVMGMTGSGKTTFISHLASPEDKPGAGHSLRSSTVGTSRYRVRIPAHLRGASIYDDIVLVDTPGFDDTTRSDLDVLRTIADELDRLRQEGRHLLGVLFLHRITDMRLTNSAIKNVTVLQKICGSDNYDRVFLATTMWDVVSFSKEASNSAQARQEELEEYWAELFGGRSAMQPHLFNTRDSAWEIVKPLLDKPNRSLEIQVELLDRPLERTKVGEYLSYGLLDARKRQELVARRDSITPSQIGNKSWWSSVIDFWSD